MSAPYQKPEVKYAGNLRDLLGQVCVGDQVGHVPADGWVLQFVRAGWAIVVAGSAPGATFTTVVSDTEGKERARYVGSKTVEESVRRGCNVLERAGVAFNRFELERFGWAMDHTP